MDITPDKTGIIVPCWDTLRQSPQDYRDFMAAASSLTDDGGLIVYSRARSAAACTILRDAIPRSFLADSAILSMARLHRLCGRVYDAGMALQAAPARDFETGGGARAGFIVSNGYGLGHVTRMRAIARGLAPYAAQDFMSFSAGMVAGAHYLPSAQYLNLADEDDRRYTRAAVLRFFNRCNPTHVFYDGNVLPPGLLSALAARPHIHLTWVRRGMWRSDVAPRYMAQQAMADMLLEPGDMADAYDDGPSWRGRMDYALPRAFLKTPPIRSLHGSMTRAQARRALGFADDARLALLMPGACQHHPDMQDLRQAVAAIQGAGFQPVIAHWPMSHDAPPDIDGARVIETMPIAPYYPAFDVLVSAAGYNSFHEILAGDVPAVFIPQEDPGRDMQLRRASFAQDKGLAVLCRRGDLAALGDAIAKAVAAPRKAAPIAWMADWAALARMTGMAPLMEVPPAPPVARDAARILRDCFRHWRRRGGIAHDTRFVLATGMDADRFAARMARKPSPHASVILTDSIDPVALRRMGHAYLWINPDSAAGHRRQFMEWLRIWKPRALVKLR